MNVKELRELLVNYPDDAMVVIPGQEGGVYEISHVKETIIALNVNSGWYYGDGVHEPIETERDKINYQDATVVPAIHLT